MRVVVLASGSKGNSVFVELDGVKVLIDAGISATRIKKGLATVGVRPEELAGVLITHEHRDHIAGLQTLLKWHRLPVFSRRATLVAVYEQLQVPADSLQPVENLGLFAGGTAEAVTAHGFELDGLQAVPFATSHDAAAPVGWRLHGSEDFVLATDLGFVTSSVQASLGHADVLVLEANHDLEMLQNGSYPWPLKCRIRSNRGHLSNTDAAWALARLGKKPEKVVLAHLSEENNRPELALATVRKILERQGLAGLMDIAAASQTEMLALSPEERQYAVSNF